MKNNFKPDTIVEHIKSGQRGIVKENKGNFFSLETALVLFDGEENPRIIITNVLKEVKNNSNGFW